MTSLKGNVCLLFRLMINAVAIDTGHYSLDRNNMG